MHRAIVRRRVVEEVKHCKSIETPHLVLASYSKVILNGEGLEETNDNDGNGFCKQRGEIYGEVLRHLKRWKTCWNFAADFHL